MKIKVFLDVTSYQLVSSFQHGDFVFRIKKSNEFFSTSTCSEHRKNPLYIDNKSELGSFLREKLGKTYGRLITRLFSSHEIFQIFD
jgi:hypothetical protein